VTLFLLEALFLGVAGALGGAFAGAGLVALCGRWGIPAFSEAQRYSYGGDYLFPTFQWADVTFVPASMVAICLVAALGPALMAARMRPADSLRYV
jgi:ABC-type lipoprotein release transport system permease subunit